MIGRVTSHALRYLNRARTYKITYIIISLLYPSCFLLSTVDLLTQEQLTDNVVKNLNILAW